METGYIDVRQVLVEFARFAALKALRDYAPKALRATGNPELITWADKLAAFKDDCDLNAARDAARDASYAASYAGDAASDASYAASYARDAASKEFNAWFESRILPLFKGEK